MFLPCFFSLPIPPLLSLSLPLLSWLIRTQNYANSFTAWGGGELCLSKSFFPLISGEGKAESCLPVFIQAGRGSFFFFFLRQHVVCERDDWWRNPFSQCGLAVPDNASLLSFSMLSTGAARGGLLGTAELIQPLIWPGQGKLLLLLPLPMLLQATWAGS